VIAVFKYKKDFKIFILRKSCSSSNVQNGVTISVNRISMECCTLLGGPFNTAQFRVTRTYRDIIFSILFSLSLLC